MPAARARHRRQLLRLRRRPLITGAATRTRRPTRAASAGLAALPRLATPPPAAMPRRPEMAASIKSPYAMTLRILHQILVTGQTRPLGRRRRNLGEHLGVDTARVARPPRRLRICERVHDGEAVAAQPLGLVAIDDVVLAA